MLAYVVGSVAARIAVVLCGVVIALAYLQRRGRLSRDLGIARQHSVPYLRWLWPHFWTGYFAGGLTVVHVGASMGAMERANAAGIWAATGALLLLVFEVAVGLSLRGGGLVARRTLRRVHFWTMICFASLLGVHLWLNGQDDICEKSVTAEIAENPR